MDKALKILVIDSHVLFRAGLRHLIQSFGRKVELHESSSIADSLLTDFDTAFEVVLFELVLPEISSSAATDAIKEKFPNAKVVILSGNENPQVIREAIDHGADGYIPKSVNHSIFVAALELIIAGEVFVPKQVLMDSDNPNDSSSFQQHSIEEEFKDLTERQKDAVILAIKGYPNKEIARDLNISEGTVKAHLSAAFKALGVRNRTEAVFRYAEFASSVDQ